MDIKVQVKPDDDTDYCRLQMGTEDGSVTFEGKSAFVVSAFKICFDASVATPGPLRDAIIEGLSEFESQEQIAAIFDKALADAGIKVSEHNADPQPEEFPPDHIDALWQRVPVHLRRGMLDYMMRHDSTGGFLQAVFEGDLALTCTRADQITRPAITHIVAYILGCAPSACWGSKEKVDQWLKKK